MVRERHEAEARAVVPLSLWAATEEDLWSTELPIDLATGDTFGRRTITALASAPDRREPPGSSLGDL